eukprot:jgi/Botrbrau1/950/Bobra.0167s0057.1
MLDIVQKLRSRAKLVARPLPLGLQLLRPGYDYSAASGAPKPPLAPGEAKEGDSGGVPEAQEASREGGVPGRGGRRGGGLRQPGAADVGLQVQRPPPSAAPLLRSGGRPGGAQPVGGPSGAAGSGEHQGAAAEGDKPPHRAAQRAAAGAGPRAPRHRRWQGHPRRLSPPASPALSTISTGNA